MSFRSDVAAQIAALKQDARALRGFGILFAVVGALAGGYMLWKGHGTSGAYAAFGAGAAFLFAAFVFPVLLKPLHKGWMALAFALGWFVSRIIFTVAFFLIITPTGLLLRLLGKDILHRRLDRKAATYWEPAEPVSDKERYTRPY